MNHIQKFEAFIIPKNFRNKIWKDEDIAIKILEDLETNGAPDLVIDKRPTSEKKYTFEYKFTINSFSVELVFDIHYPFTKFSNFNEAMAPPSGISLIYNLYIDDVRLNVSDEVCKKIQKVLDEVEKEHKEFIKKDFRKTNKI